MRQPTMATAILAGALMVGCDQIAPPGMGAKGSDGAETPPSPASPPAATPAPSRPAAAPPEARSDPRVASFHGLEAPKPVTWIWHPPTDPMRTANYAVPAEESGEAGEIAVFHFPGGGGSKEANIARWVDQFRSADGTGGPVDPIVTELEADGMPVTLVELAGEYQRNRQTWFTPDQLFLTAIVEAPVGTVFIRMTGPTAVVEANREHFMDMIRGLRKVDP